MSAGQGTAATLGLPDGRRLAYSDLGDPAGAPALYFHGFPSSRREAELLDREAQDWGLRLLSPDRPGYGDSDPAQTRRIPDFAADCEALADGLGLARLSLIGVSGGAPYALACAERLADRIAACALVCPLGPIYRPELLGAMGWFAEANFTLARGAPGLAMSLFASPLPGLFAEIPHALSTIRHGGCNAADREALGQGQARRILDETIREALRNGAPGARQDLKLYTEDWGVDFAAIDGPLDLWQGDADLIVPPAHASWYERHLPDGILHLLPGEGHYSLPLRHASDILRTLQERGRASPHMTIG